MVSNLRDKTTQVKEDISITRKLRFEKLVSSISSRFVGNYELDKVINKSLADMGEFIHASRVFIFLFNKEKPYMINTHEWCNVNAESHINDYKHLQLNEVPWVIKQLLKGNPLIIEDVSRLPPEAKNIKNLLKNHGVKANITIPLYINGEIGGFIGFDDDLELRNWVEEDLNLLQISSRIIGNAIERKLTEDILKESEKRYRELFNTMSSGVAVYKAIHNGEAFIFKDLNLAAQKIEKIKKKEVIGKKVTKIFPSIKEFGLFEVFQRVWKTGEPLYHPISLYQDERIAGWRENYVYKLPSGEIVAIYNDLTEKAEIEKKLKESEEKYRLITENASDLIVVLNSKYEHEYINENTYQRILGYNNKDMLGKTRHDIIHPDDIKRALKIIREDFKRGRGRGELRLRHRNGNYIWVDTTGSVFKGSDDQLRAITVSRDITERKLSEQRLKESEENFREITEQSFMGICIIKDSSIQYINKTITKMLGYSEKEIKEWSMKEFLNVVHPEDRGLIIKRLSHRQKGLIDEKFDRMYRIFTKNGEIKWMDTYSKTIQYQGKDAILAALVDVTERKKAEQKLSESEEKYRSVLENINEGYFEVDLEGNFTFFNDALCKSSGYSREELLNKSYSMVFDEETKERVFRVYNDLYKKGEGFKLINSQVIRKDGDRIYQETSVYLRYNSNGEIIGFKGFFRDVSERKRAEALRKKFSQELEREVKLRTKELKVALDQQKLYLDQILKASHFKTEFLATMSHELRTPLNAIIGFTDLLLEGVYGQLNSEQLEFIKDIEESSKHLLDMISNILDISKIESGQVSVKIDNIQLYDLVNQVISTLKSLYSKKDLKIELKDVKKKQIILADRLKFKQIIYNLLSNAIKFTEKGTVTFEFIDKKDNWEFNVKDTGIGIAKEDLNIIFKDFKRVKFPYVDSMPGSGLGLSLTKRIINLHGGNISFTSKLGMGSTFSFYIPKKITNSLRVEELLKYL